MNLVHLESMLLRLINSLNSNMVVSKNRGGPPKSSILIGFSLVNHPFLGTPIFGNTHMEPENGGLERYLRYTKGLAAMFTFQPLVLAVVRTNFELFKLEYLEKNMDLSALNQ